MSIRELKKGIQTIEAPRCRCGRKLHFDGVLIFPLQAILLKCSRCKREYHLIGVTT